MCTRAAAERLDCECFLALAEVHEIWMCEDDYPGYRYRRRGRYYEEDSPESESTDYELIDLQDSTIELNHWLLIKLVDEHGLSWAKELVTEWTKNHHWGLAAWVPLLADICGDLHASDSAPSKAFATWLLERELKLALERCIAAFKRPSPWLDLDGFTEESTHLAHVLAAAVAMSAFQVVDETLSSLLDDKRSVPTSFLVFLLQACITRSPALGARVIGSPLHCECIARLGAIVREPVRATGDRTIAYPLICTCNDCKVLAHFLASARTEHDWPLNKDRRQHIHGTIDFAKLPIRHTTLRRGSPHILQLRKDDSLFSRERSYRLRIKQILEALPATPSQ